MLCAVFLACQAQVQAHPLTLASYGSVEVDYGPRQFCEHMPEECIPSANTEPVPLTPERLVELDEVNRYVNTHMRAATDCELYHTNEWWTLAEAAGDCEDKAILKRHLLMVRGWPASALLLTRVLTLPEQEGHAVLMVRSTDGDYILDNLRASVEIAAEATHLVFIKRQSPQDPKKWESLIPPGSSSQKLADQWTSCVKGCQVCRPP